MSPPPSILLVHGLWLNRAIMIPLGMRLRAAGFRVHYFGYYSALRPHGHNVAKLAAHLRGYGANRPHIVAHSLGALVSLQALAELPPLPGTKTRLIGLGPPWRGSEAGRQFMRHALGRLFVGASGSLWQTFPDLQMPRTLEVATIVGTRRVGMGRFFARLDEPNDGVVTIAETQPEGLADHIVMPVSHTGMLLSKKVATQCAAFLRDGRFSR